MSDQEVIDAGIARAESENRDIDDLTAKVIANAWHCGQSSALYAFTSTGAIIHDDVWGEVREDYRVGVSEDRRELDHLGTYLLNAGVRGPVAGWSDLSW